MTVQILNPDSTVLQQMEGHWQKIATLLVWKLARAGVHITGQDMAEYGVQFAAGEAFLLTHGHHDSIELKIVSEIEARRLAEYDARFKGHA